MNKTERRDYDNERYRKRRMRMIAHLGGKCARCPSVNGLEFDHIDATTKLYNVSPFWTKRWSDLLIELDKCQLLCDSCHLNKSLTEGDVPVAFHGSLGMYTYHKCRCDECKMYWNLKTKEYKQKRKNAGLVQQ